MPAIVAVTEQVPAAVTVRTPEVIEHPDAVPSDTLYVTRPDVDPPDVVKVRPDP